MGLFIKYTIIAKIMQAAKLWIHVRRIFKMKLTNLWISWYRFCPLAKFSCVHVWRIFKMKRKNLWISWYRFCPLAKFSCVHVWRIFKMKIHVYALFVCYITTNIHPKDPSPAFRPRSSAEGRTLFHYYYFFLF